MHTKYIHKYVHAPKAQISNNTIIVDDNIYAKILTCHTFYDYVKEIGLGFLILYVVAQCITFLALKDI